MSSAARFVLEFEATGDQEVVNKIKAVGAAGKETATELESLQGIQDPFEPIATGADAAVAPIEGVGTAAEGTVTPLEGLTAAGEESVSAFTEMGSAADTAITPIEGVGTASEGLGGIFSGAGTAVGDFSANLDAVGGAADAATGGLTPANTMMGNFAESTGAAGASATTAAGNVGQFAGSITAIGGIIGSAVGSIFRLQDAQLRLDKANLRAAKSTESARKAEQAFFDLLAKAPGNRDAIAAATETYIAAQERLTSLQEAGITTGAEYEAAQAAVATATTELKAAFVAGGGEATKFDAALNKMNLTNDAAAIAAATAAKAAREQGEAMLDTAFSVTSIVGTMAQFVAGSKGMIDNAKAMKTALGTALAPMLAKVGGAIGTFSLALGGSLGPMAAFAAALGPAALAVGAFLAAIKLIEHFRAPIYAFFNGIGKAVGNAIPPIKAFVTELGNALDSSLEFLIRNTNALFGIQTKTVDNTFQLLQKFQKDRQSLNDEEVQSALAIIKVSKMRGETEAETVKRILPILKMEAEGKITTAEASQLMASGSLDVANAAGVEGEAIKTATKAKQINKQMSDAQAAALEKVTGSAHGTAVAVGLETDAIGQLNTETVKSITTLQEQTRAQILANAGFNNAAVAALQYQAALTAMTQSMVNDTDQKNANAQATLTLVNSELNAQNAIATVNQEYANSVDRLNDLQTVLDDAGAKTKAVATASNEFAASLMEQQIELEGTIQGLQDVSNQEQGVANAILQTKVSLEESNQALREAKAVRDDMGASTAQLRTALNEEQTALIEEEAALQASIAAGNDSVVMRQRLDNAYLEGVNSIQEWNTELATSAEAEQGAIDMLNEFGLTFADLPGYMEPTIENLQLVREAELGVGDAAKEMADMAVENWNKLTSGADSLMNSLTSAFQKGGKEQKEALKSAWEDLPEDVRDSMSKAQKEELEGIAEMQAAAESAIIELGIDLNTADFRTARADFTSNLEQLAADSEGKWSEMWAKAAELAEGGTQDMVEKIKAIIEEGGGPEAMLQSLNALETDMPGVGNKLATALTGGFKGGFTGNAVIDAGIMANMAGLDNAPAAGEQVGKAAGEGFGTGFTGNAVFDANTMVNNSGLNELPAKSKQIGADSGIALEQEFAKQIGSIVNTINTMQLKPIPITADVQQAGSAIASIVNTLSSLKPPAIKVQVDNATALQQINVVKIQLNAIKQTKIPKVTVNNVTAIQQINVVKTQLNNIKQTKIPKVTVNNSQALSQINKVKSALNSLKNITRTITYRYKTVGSPPRGAQHGMHERLAEDTLIAAHKGEKVDISPYGGPAIEKPGPTHTITTAVGGGRGGGGNEIVIPVTLMLDNKVLIRTVRRGLVEEVSGAM